MNIIHNTLVKVIRFLHKLDIYFNKNTQTEFEYQFMIPTRNAKNIEPYEKLLLKALEEKQIKNIAITGDYGAGKSSFIKTFEYKYFEYNFLDISLATFDKTGTNLSLIEKSILEQIFYKESFVKIPQSRFKKIMPYKLIWLKSIIGILGVFSLIYLLKPKFISQLEIYKNIEQMNNDYVEYGAITILFIGLFYIFQYFIKNFKGFSLNKLNLQNIEVESKKDDESSLLNKYLDEILYFFQKTDYDIVIFQDLDRFDNLDIFTKLRELNNFLNNSNQVNKRVIFLYVLKDAMFKNQNERVKFFDVIIPIIPYINSKTSYDVLYKWFKYDIDKKFLKGVSIHIQDMRLLNNIFNEFKIFDTQIGQELDKTKLLAMVIYKNFYPEDYSKLHRGKSLINKFIVDKYKYKKRLENEYFAEIDKIKLKIEQLKQDLKNNLEVKELRAIYIYEIIKKLDINDSYFYCNNQRIYILNATNDSEFNKIRECDNLKYRNTFSFQEIEKMVNKDLSYKEREEVILLKTNDKIENLENEIQNINKKIENLNRLALREILKELELFKGLRNKYELFKYLLLNGYIDEDFYMYISFDMQNALTSNDITFLKNIKTNNIINFNFRLNNIDEILEYLDDYDFYKKAILNLSLVSYLIENNTKYNQEIQNFFNFLMKEDEDIEKFIAYCIDWIPSRNLFVKFIVKYNQDTWKIIEKYGTKTSLDSYCGWIFHYANYEDIKKLYNFKEYFENKTFMQSFSGDEAKKLIHYIEEFNIKFKQLKEVSESFQIMNYIYENNHYILNKQMVDFVLGSTTQIKKKLSKSHLTTIKELANNSYILSYIEENINEYIKNIFLTIDENIFESETTVIELLNNEKLESDLKISIIEKEEVVILKITDIERKELWNVVFNNNKIEANWNNISSYFIQCKKSIDDVLLQFLQNLENAMKLSETKINTEFCEKNQDFDTSVLYKILINNELDLEAYKILLKSNDFLYEEIDIAHLDIAKIDLLLSYGKFQLTQENLENLKQFEKHLKLIEENSKEFYDNLEDFIELLDQDDLEQILKSQKFNNQEKLQIINQLDLEKIDTKLAEVIINILVTDKFDFENDLLLKVFEVLDEKLKYILLYLSKYEVSCSDINDMLSYFDFPYNQLCTIGNDRLDLEISNANEKLLKILRDKHCISSLRKIKNKYQVFRKRK